MFASITQVQTEMAQNNSIFLFFQKTSNKSRGRQNLRVEMNQVTNLKSSGFTWKKYQIYLESPQVFNPHIAVIFCFAVDGVAN